MAKGDVDREEARLLAPWLANGTLEAGEAAALEAEGGRDIALAQDIAAARAEAQALGMVGTEAQQAPSHLWHRIEQTIIAQENSARQKTRWEGTLGGALARVSNFARGNSSHDFRAAFAAACAILVIQAAAITYLIATWPPATPAVTVASGLPQTGPLVASKPDRFTLLVKFAPGTSAGAIEGFLKDRNAEITAGPDLNGAFRVAAERDSSKDFIAALRASGLAQSVEGGTLE